MSDYTPPEDWTASMDQAARAVIDIVRMISIYRRELREAGFDDAEAVDLCARMATDLMGLGKPQDSA